MSDREEEDEESEEEVPVKPSPRPQHGFSSALRRPLGARRTSGFTAAAVGAVNDRSGGSDAAGDNASTSAPEVRPKGKPGRLLGDILDNKTPEEAAEWFFDEVKQLQQDADLERSDLYHLATALQTATTQQRQKAVRNVVSGLAQLPPKQRGRALPLVFDVAESFKTAQAGQPAGAEKADSSLAKNLQKIAQVASAGRKDGSSLQEVARQEAISVVQKDPRLVLDTVTELPKSDRSRLLEKLASTDLLPKDQKAILEQVVAPGGYADIAKGGLEGIQDAASKRYWIPASAILQLVVYIFYGHRACRNRLMYWLWWDAVLTVITVWIVLYICYVVFPCLEKLQKDPGSTLAGLQEGLKNGWSPDVVQATGLFESEFRRAKNLSALVLILALFLMLYSVLAVIRLLAATLSFKCSFSAWVFCTGFVAFKVYVLAKFFFFVQYLRTQRQQLLAESENKKRRSFGSLGGRQEIRVV